MSALPILELQTAQSGCLFILARKRELGLDRCGTGQPTFREHSHNFYRQHLKWFKDRGKLKICPYKAGHADSNGTNEKIEKNLESKIFDFRSRANVWRMFADKKKFQTAITFFLLIVRSWDFYRRSASFCAIQNYSHLESVTISTKKDTIGSLYYPGWWSD